MSVYMRNLGGGGGEEFCLSAVRLVRSNHDMWTLEVRIYSEHGSGYPMSLVEHILLSPSQIDNFMSTGVPVKNPLPVSRKLSKK